MPQLPPSTVVQSSTDYNLAATETCCLFTSRAELRNLWGVKFEQKGKAWKSGDCPHYFSITLTKIAEAISELASASDMDVIHRAVTEQSNENKCCKFMSREKHKEHMAAQKEMSWKTAFPAHAFCVRSSQTMKY